jgi:hypothetical protein
MVMNDWQARCWRLLKARFAPAARQSRRLRRQRANPLSVVAAQVEQLEPRQLLTVTFHGGALLTAVSAQAVYLGSDWQSTSSLQAQKGQLDQFVSTIVQGSYMDMLTNAGYNVGRGTSTAGAIDNLTLNKSSGITDSQIRADLQAMITAGQVQAPGANNLYVVYVEPGVVPFWDITAPLRATRPGARRQTFITRSSPIPVRRISAPALRDSHPTWMT